MPDSRNDAESLLLDIESRLDSVDCRLLAADPAGIEQACAALRDATVALADMLEAASALKVLGNGGAKRIQAIARRLHDQRTCVARRSVMVGRALGSIMRPQTAATYQISGERMAFGGGPVVAGR